MTSTVLMSIQQANWQHEGSACVWAWANLFFGGIWAPPPACLLMNRCLCSSGPAVRCEALGRAQLVTELVLPVECILSLSCPWHFLSDGTVEEKNTGRDKLMRKDRDLLVSAAKFPYILSYAIDGSRLLQIGNAPVCRLLQTLFAYYR